MPTRNHQNQDKETNKNKILNKKPNKIHIKR